MFKRIPFLNRRELRAILDRAEQHPDGCLILPPLSLLANPNAVTLRGEPHTVTRIIWAETRGDRDLDTHEVVHIAECPHAGGHRGVGVPYAPLCINIDHLILALPGTMRMNLRWERHAAYRAEARS